MKKLHLLPLVCSLLIFVSFGAANAQITPKPLGMPEAANPWNEKELLEPAVLAGGIKDGKVNIPVVFNIGAVEDIKGARHIGPVNNAENLEKFKTAIAGLPKNTAIVIYCGCCPFTKCPNIRPAFTELKKAGFTDIKLLNLATNLKTNWIAMGYPLAK